VCRAAGRTRGELPEEMAEKYEKLRKAFEALQRTTSTLAETVDREPPVLQESDVTRVGGDGRVSIIVPKVCPRSSHASHQSSFHRCCPSACALLFPGPVLFVAAVLVWDAGCAGVSSGLPPPPK
jgi:hypothetical protein